MFILDEKKSRWFPVEVELHNDEGRKRTFTFDAEFEVVDQSEINTYLEALQSSVEAGRVIEKDVDLADRRMVGWRHVQLPDGQPLPVTPENRRRLIEQPGVARGIVRAWMKSVGIEGKK